MPSDHAADAGSLRVADYVPAPAAETIRADYATLKDRLARTRLDTLALSHDKSAKGAIALRKIQIKGEETRASMRRLELLANYTDMKLAYSKLQSVITEDRQWALFIRAALVLQRDYRAIQVARRRKIEQMADIEKAAMRLAKLLRALATAEDNSGPLHNLIELLAKNRDTEKMLRHTNAFPHLVGTGTVEVADLIAQVAREYKPASFSAFAAALAGRKRAPIPDYIRAFAGALTAGGFEIKPSVITAIAIAVSACNNDGKVVTSDDVRKALNLAQRRKP